MFSTRSGSERFLLKNNHLDDFLLDIILISFIIVSSRHGKAKKHEDNGLH